MTQIKLSVRSQEGGPTPPNCKTGSLASTRQGCHYPSALRGVVLGEGGNGVFSRSEPPNFPHYPLQSKRVVAPWGATWVGIYVGATTPLL